MCLCVIKSMCQVKSGGQCVKSMGQVRGLGQWVNGLGQWARSGGYVPCVVSRTIQGLVKCLV